MALSVLPSDGSSVLYLHTAFGFALTAREEPGRRSSVAATRSFARFAAALTRSVVRGE